MCVLKMVAFQLITACSKQRSLLGRLRRVLNPEVSLCRTGKFSEYSALTSLC